jgi:hypothetical protein
MIPMRYPALHSQIAVILHEMTVMTYELVSNGMAPGAIVPGARIQVRDALWTIQRVIPNEPGNLIEAKGLSGIVRGKEAIFIDLIEPSLKVVSPTDTELVADVSPGFEDTKLFLESAFRTSAPTGPEPLVLGNAAIDDLLFQHVPVRRALTQPRVRLLLADDVGLGKTLEAGLVTAELILRKRADRVLVVTTKATLAQFQKEFWARFSIPLVRLDSVAIQRMRNAIPTNHNQFDQFDKAIISVDTLKNDNQYRIKAARAGILSSSTRPTTSRNESQLPEVPRCAQTWRGFWRRNRIHFFS